MTSLLSRNQSPAFGDTARWLALIAIGLRKHLQDSRSLGGLSRQVLNELQVVFDETRLPDWDGFGAVPITPEVRTNIEVFIKTLPLGSPTPTVGAEPDGYMTLEWYQSPRKTLSVSVGVDRIVHFASIQDDVTEHGKFAISETLPLEFWNLIQRFE